MRSYILATDMVGYQYWSGQEGFVEQFREYMARLVADVGRYFGPAPTYSFNHGDGWMFLFAESDPRKLAAASARLQGRLDEQCGNSCEMSFETRMCLVSGTAERFDLSAAPSWPSDVKWAKPLTAAWTGDVFTRGARVLDKVRPYRAVLSPVVDGRIAHSAHDDAEIQPVSLGRFAMRVKAARAEAPWESARDEDPEAREELFWICLRDDQEQLALAQNLRSAVLARQAGDRGGCLNALQRLSGGLTAARLGRIQRSRWECALRHYAGML